MGGALGFAEIWGNFPQNPPFGRKPRTPQNFAPIGIELLDPENLAGGIKIREFHKIKNTPVVV